MVKYTASEIRSLMDKPEDIRNISIIAHVDHGKTTLTDSLMAKGGLISQELAGGDNCRLTDFLELEKEKGITIKSTGVTLCFDVDKGDGIQKPYLINLIDSPGHVDFSSEVTAALRVTDGALVIVDCIEGVCVQTETVLRQAMTEKIKPILMINKMDRMISEQQLGSEEMYQQFIRIIDNVNVIISQYQPADMEDLMMVPEKGMIIFGAGKQCWAFNLRTFARIYSKKFNIDEDKMVAKLWGDNYYDPEIMKWTTEGKSVSGKTLKRGFCEFIVEPIVKITKMILEGKHENLPKALEKIGVILKESEKAGDNKKLLKTVMSKWINAGDVVSETIVNHLPSPVRAQMYRAAYLYEGPQEDMCCQSIARCDPNGPLIVYISKMVPTPDRSRFLAFGRVFSGTVRTGQKVRIMGPNYVPGKKEDIYEKAIQKTVIMMGRTIEALADVPCGNTVALVGIDQYLLKTGTISDCEEAHNIRVMKYSVSPVVRVAVQPKYPADLPKLVEGLKRLAKSDPLVQCTTEETGENVIAGSGELHIEICLHDLQKEYANIDIISSDPIVSYKETVLKKSNQICLAKTSNGHNRFYATAEPLSEELCQVIEKGDMGPRDDLKARAKRLVDEFLWSKDEAVKLWTFGPENTGANVLVDVTKGVQYMDEVRDSLDNSFQFASKLAVLTEENMRGIRFNIVDSILHADSIHRGGGQVIPAGRRLYHSSTLTACPALQEPMFQVDISSPLDAIGGVYQVLNQRRGEVVEQEQLTGTPLVQIRAYLPVAESFGFTGALRGATAGQAFPQCVFHHWSHVTGSPLEAGTKPYEIVMDIRKRKGLKEGLPKLEDYLDKL